jgi:hypothetical protein
MTTGSLTVMPAPSSSAIWDSRSSTPMRSADLPARSGSSMSCSHAVAAICHSATPAIGSRSGSRPMTRLYQDRAAA